MPEYNPVSKRPIKHGRTNTVEFRIWVSMLNRCRNPNVAHFHYYGGRGITVCPEWLDFARFYADMGPRPSPVHSLERIDNDGPYEPRNVRWATPGEQGKNRRNNRLIEWRGEKLTTMQWSERVGFSADTIKHRIQRGWTPEQALTLPLGTSPTGGRWGKVGKDET